MGVNLSFDMAAGPVDNDGNRVLGLLQAAALDHADCGVIVHPGLLQHASPSNILSTVNQRRGNVVTARIVDMEVRRQLPGQLLGDFDEICSISAGKEVVSGMVVMTTLRVVSGTVLTNWARHWLSRKCS